MTEPTKLATTNENIAEPRFAISERQGGKPLVRWFCSYAHADGDWALRLRKGLELQLGNSKHYCFEAWHDAELLAGEDWHQQITDHLRQCHLGICLLSHDFLASDYIARHELPAFVHGDGSGVQGRRLVPVLLKPVEFETSDLGGLQARQIFSDGDGRAFSERRGHRLTKWIGELVQQLHRIVDRHGEEVGEGSGSGGGAPADAEVRQ